VPDTRAAGWFVDTKRDDALAGYGRRQPAPTLFLVAVAEDRRWGDGDVGADPGGHPTGAGPPQLFKQDRLVQRPGIGAAISIWIFQAQQVEGGAARKQFPRELLSGLPFFDVGPDLRVDEAAHRPPKGGG